MQITPCLIFNGQRETAFRHYADVPCGDITTLVRFGETPGCDGMPPATRQQVMHARLSAGDNAPMGSDPARLQRESRGMSVALNVEDRAGGERIFEALAAGGTLRMAFEATFRAEGLGMCVDRFGTPWMVNAGAQQRADQPGSALAHPQPTEEATT